MNKIIEKIKKYIPVPSSIRFDHAGIDIGASHIRHISFKCQKGELVVDKYGVEDLSHSIEKKSSLSDNNDVIDVLKKIQKNNKYKYVEASIPEELAYVYTQEVDDGECSSILGQIEFKIEENVPFKADEAVFDFSEVLKVSNNKKLLSVTVVSKKTIDDYVSVFQKANMKIVSFLIQNQALAKSLVDKGDNKSYCIVTVEKKCVVVSIVASGMVLYTSTIEKTAFDDDLNPGRREILEEIIKDIKRIITYWGSYIDQNKDYKFENINSIIVSSTHSNIIESEFINMLANHLLIPILKPNVWVNVCDLEKNIPSINKIESYQYATAIGLALPKLK